MTGAAQRGEYRYPLTLALAMAALGTLPFLYARVVAPEDALFMEQLGRGPDGSAGYLMFARQAWEGHWLFTNRMTAEPVPHAYLGVEWLFFGWVARLPGSSMAVAMHVFRCAAVLGYALAFYFLAVQTLDSRFKRRLAVTLAMTLSGMGWMLVAANTAFGWKLPLTPDAMGVSLPAYLVNKPHFVLDYLFALLKYACFIRGWKTGRSSWFALAGLAAAAQSAIRPFHLPETCLLLCAFPLLAALREGRWDWRPCRQSAVMLATMLPFVLVFAHFSSDNILARDAWRIDGGFYLTGWGQPKSLIEILIWISWPAWLFIAALPRWLQLRRLPEEQAALVFWTLAAWGFTQLSPYYGGGQEAALAAYASAPLLLALAWTLPALARLVEERTGIALRRHRAAAAALLVLAGLPGSAWAWSQMAASVSDPAQRDSYYMPARVAEALDWIAAQQAGDVVLAARDTSRYIPALSPLRVVAGHYMYTPEIETIAAEVERFFRGRMTPDECASFLRARRVDWVVHGPYEAKLGGPPAHPALKLVKDFGEVSVHRVEWTD